MPDVVKPIESGSLKTHILIQPLPPVAPRYIEFEISTVNALINALDVYLIFEIFLDHSRPITI